MLRSIIANRRAAWARVAGSVVGRRTSLTLQRLEDRVNPVLGTFELDGNTTTQTGHDWDQVYNDAVLNPGENTSGSIPGAVIFIHDLVNSPADNIFTGGGSADINDLNSWQIKQGAPQSKADIADVYAAAYTVLVGGQSHTIINFGADRITNSASTSLGFWFFQKQISVNPNGGISGLHTSGDILVVADFSNFVATISAYKWVGPGGSQSSLQLLATDPTNLTALVNTANTPSGGWPFTSSSPAAPTNTFAPGEFFEGGIDLTALGLPNDLSQFVAETRSSSSLTASLSDFVIGRLTTFASDLAVTKTVSNPTPNVGDTITFTVTLTNNGPNNATGVSVNDRLPSGLSFVSATPSQGTYNSTTGVWTVGNVARGQTLSLQLQARVVSANTQINTATVAHLNETDPDSSNNQASATETPQQADLAVTKSVSNPTPNVGDTITFTLTVTNNGPDAATNVTVQDLLPSGLTFVSATPSQGTYNAGTGVWTVGTVTTATAQTLQIRATVASPNAQTNSGSISHADQFDPVAGNNSGSAAETPQQADLAVTKSVSNPTPNVGDTITYTITLNDNGPDPATNVTLTDLLPAGVAFVSATPSQGTYNAGTGVWTVGTVTTTVQQTLLIRGTVTSANPGANTAAISHSDQFDPNTANNSDTASTNPQEADLAVTKTVSNSRPNVGDTVTFTVTLLNTGPNGATGVQVTDLLPVGLSFVSATPSQGTYNPATGLWTVGGLANGAQATLALQALVASSAARTNMATISRADQLDSNTGNNTDSATETPQQADLAITKSVDNPTPNVGDTITFTVALRNAGPDLATNVRINDLLPSGLTFVSAVPTQGSYDNTTGTWLVGNVATSTAPELTLTARVNSAASLTNTVSIGHSDQFDPNTNNNSSSATETPQRSDLRVIKTVSDSTPNVGDVITFTVTLTNLGPNAATNVQVSDLLPSGLDLVSATPSQGSYNSTTGQWSVGTVGTLLPATLALDAKVQSPNSLTNTAVLSHSDQFDPNSANNQFSASETPQHADLSLTKTVSDSRPNAGDTITFTVTLRNAGPDAATGVQIDDLLPAGLMFVSAAPSQGTYDPNTGVWVVGNVSPGTPQTLAISATVASSGPSTNTATVGRADQFDPDPGNNTASVTETPRQSDLAVTKTVSNSTPNVGDVIFFTVRVTNNGPDTASDVRLTDQLPTGLTLVLATPSQGSYNSNTGDWSVGTLVNGASATLTLLVEVASLAAQTNTASVSHLDQFDPVPVNDTASATETPQRADLIVAKTVNDLTPNVGDTITFTVTLANNGPDPATGVRMTDLLPAGLTFVSATPSLGSYNSTTGVWTVGTVTPGTPQTLTISARVVNPLPRTNTATLAAVDQFDPNTSNNTASVTETPQQADLAMFKSVSDPKPNLGDTITFTLIAGNAGPNTATGVNVIDQLPAGVTFVSATASQGAYDNVTGVWTVGSVAPSATATLTINATVNVPGQIENTATVDGDQFDPNTGNNSSGTTHKAKAADLAVVKTVSDPTPNVGDTITFTIIVANTGPDQATGVTVTDQLPVGVSFVSATASQGAYDNVTGIWTVGTVASAATATLSITVSVIAPTGITNTASVVGDEFDPNTANNSDSTSSDPQSADLALFKSVSDATPNVGDQITFTVTLTNTGPSTATGVQVTDLLPSGLAFVSAAPSQGTYTAGSGLWDVGTVPSGTPLTLSIVATVANSAPQSNTATISHSDQFDPDPGNNTSTVTETPQQSDLTVTKSVSNSTPNVGDTITFLVTLINGGPDIATGVQLTDLLPVGLTLVTATPSQGTYNSTTGVWTVGSITPGAALTLSLTATVVSPAPRTNTASITDADQFDPNTANNTASAIEIPLRADLRVIKSVSNPTPNVGDTINFTVVVTNLGPDTATGVQLTDLLPPGLTPTLVRTASGRYDPTTGKWDIGTLLPGESRTLTLTVLVVSPDPRTNTATITAADQFDPNTANNTASATETPQRADLSLTKSASNARPNVGDNVTFIITLRNSGPNPATGVQINDPLPIGLTFVSATPSQGTYDPATGVWDVGTVSPGTPQTLMLNATVVSPTAQTNTATVGAADQFDPNSGNNTASITETPQQSDLVVTKTVSNTTPNVGDTITFTVRVTNAGPDAATGVQLTDQLPAGLTFVSATPSQGTYSPATGTWTIGSIANAATATLTIRAVVASPDALTNSATISDSNQFDPDTSNNSGSTTETPQQADLSVTKTVSNSTPNVGDTVTFTVTLTNNGPTGATNVRLKDILPTGLAFVSATPSQGTYASLTGVWNVGSLGSGAQATLTLSARVIGANSVTNAAGVTAADQFDPDTSNNTANASVTPQQSDLAVTKVVSDASPNLGDVISYTITLTNLGPDAASGVLLRDRVPAGLAFVAATPSQGTYDSATGIWIVGDLANGASATLVLNARVTATAPGTNVATITNADQFDPDNSNNSASAPLNEQQVDLVVGKTVSNARPNQDEVITFTVSVTNRGPNTATNVSLRDVVPAGLVVLGVIPSQGIYDPATGVWTVGAVTTAVPATLEIQARVATPALKVNLAAIISLDQPDSNPANNSDQVTVTPRRADLAVTKSVSDPRPDVGDTVTFTVRVTNNGPDAATGVQLTDLLPAGLTLVSADPSQGTYDSSTGIWVIGTVANGAAATLLLRAQVATPGGATNSATISAEDQFDTVPANNSDSASTTPRQAGLSVTKTVSNARPNVGDTVTFTVTLHNSGPDAAQNVLVTDLLPAGLTFVSATPSTGSYDSTSGEWSLALLANGATATLQIRARVDAAGTATNTGTITGSTTFDPDPGDNQSSTAVTPQQADLVVSKTVDTPNPNLGDTIAFTVAVTNSGPDAATNVRVTDLLPPGLTFVSATPSQGTYSSATGLWTAGTIASGATATLVLRATVAVPGQLTNTAAATATQFDPNPGNNEASTTLSPQQADLVLGKSVDNPLPNVGDTITFTILVRNAGPDAATNVQVTDAIPAGLSFQSATPTQGTYNPTNGLWTVGTLSVDGEARLSIRAVATSPNLQLNVARVTGADQFDPDTGNNVAQAAVDPQEAELVLTKSVDNPRPNVGDTVTFTVTLENLGPDPATGVQITDALPPGVAFVSATPDQGSFNSASGVWNVGTVAEGATLRLTITARVISPNAQLNVAAITHADQPDPNPQNNDGSASVIPQQSNLAVFKSVDNSRPNVGDTVSFTVTVSNLGKSTATNVTLTDLLPAGLALVAATPSQGTYDSGTGTWDVGSVTTSTAQTLVLQATVTSANPSPNIVTVTHSDQFDPDTTNNQAQAGVTPQSADLLVQKSVDNTRPNVGDVVTFTVTLTNLGADAATGVSLTDLLPAGLTFVSAAPDQGTYVAATGVWSVGTVLVNQPVDLVLRARVASPGTATNIATLTSSDQFDPNTGNNSANTSLTSQQADLVVTKAVDNPRPNVGDTVTFTVTVTNVGPDAATGVTINDALPAGLVFQSATPSQGTYSQSTGVWTVGTIPSGGLATLQLMARVTGAQAAANTAVVESSAQFDPNPANNTASAAIQPQVADVAVTKVVDIPKPNVGDTVTFTVTATNHGPDAASGVTVTDFMPVTLQLLTATPSVGTYDPATGTWTIGTLANGEVATLTLTARVTGPSAATNLVAVRSAQFDPDQANNSASAAVVPPQADVRVVKKPSTRLVAVGQTMFYTIDVSNLGPDAATNVVVTDRLPAGLTFVGVSRITQGTYDSRTGRWSVGTLASGARAQIRIQVKVMSAGSIANSATATLDQFDPVLRNNRSLVSILAHIPGKGGLLT